MGVTKKLKSKLKKRFSKWKLVKDDKVHWHYERRYKWKK